ncbi:hypothetical protein ABPG74_016167 [Tetrahymena malaccensis]
MSKIHQLDQILKIIFNWEISNSYIKDSILDRFQIKVPEKLMKMEFQSQKIYVILFLFCYLMLIKQQKEISKEYKSSLLCVIDGQGGNKCTKFIVDNLEKIIQDQFMTNQIEFNDQYFNEKVIDNLKQLIFELDLKFQMKYPNVSKLCGATIAINLILGNRLFAGWLGDCQTIIFSESKIVRLTNDHIPSRQDEVKRIENQGGFIQDDRLQVIIQLLFVNKIFSIKREQLLYLDAQDNLNTKILMNISQKNSIQQVKQVIQKVQYPAIQKLVFMTLIIRKINFFVALLMVQLKILIQMNQYLQLNLPFQTQEVLNKFAKISQIKHQNYQKKGII